MSGLPFELVIVKKVRLFRLFIGDASTIKKAYLRWALVLSVGVHHSIQLMVGTLFFVESLDDAFAFTVPTLSRKVHLLMTPLGFFLYAFWWRKKEVLLQVAYEVTHLLVSFQVPLSAELRTQIISELESRHSRIIHWMAGSSQFVICSYALPPIVTFLRDPSPDRQLILPMGLPDPVSLLGATPDDLTRAVVYFAIIVSTLVNVYVVWFGLGLAVAVFDSLKTLFRLSGHIFETLGDVDDPTILEEQFPCAVRFHQEIFRLSTKAHIMFRSLLAVAVSSTVGYNVICVAAIAKELHLHSLKYVAGTLSNVMTIACYCIVPASASHVAEEIGNHVYFNKTWTTQRLESTRYFPLVIMRANKQLKFRIFNWWPLTSENFIKYLDLQYSICVMLGAVTSSSTKDSVIPA